MRRIHCILVLGATLVAAVGTGCTEREKQQARNDARKAGQTAERELSHAATITAVKAKLAADVRLATLKSIDVDVQGHVVTLSGSVPTSYDKQKAELAARSVGGVTSVVNNLVVKPDL